jgi:hypothetical protein
MLELRSPYYSKAVYWLRLGLVSVFILLVAFVVLTARRLIITPRSLSDSNLSEVAIESSDQFFSSGEVPHPTAVPLLSHSLTPC